MVKLIAFYLPQFHRVKENDEWWGEGFTEWTNVKKAKPFVQGQVQPKIPLNGNYYDLTDKKTVEWQTQLMKYYGLSSFCYFHYWFMGRKLLEKPAENLLEWKDIDQPFCFAWANCTWARTWSAAKATEWVCNDNKTSGTGILIEQLYGEEKDWREHYEYLSRFFHDERYIKKDNKPVFLIYKLHDIECAKEMFEDWNKWAKEEGFNGIHIVSMNEMPDDNKYVEAVARYGYYSQYQRHYAQKVVNKVLRAFRLKEKEFSLVFDYKKVWQGLLKEEPISNIQTYPGAVVTYDETPRRGNRAVYLKGASPDAFEKYLSKQIVNANTIYHADYIFIDAWNEWGEGNYLEPDEENGYGYLEALKNAISTNNDSIT